MTHPNTLPSSVTETPETDSDRVSGQVTDAQIDAIYRGLVEAGVSLSFPSTVSPASAMRAALRTTPSLPPRSGGVVVKGLEWESRVAWRWTAASLVGNYEVDADSATPGEEFIWSLDREYGGYASTVPAAKAAAQADYEARILSTLADPIPEAPADEEVGGPNVGLARDEWLAAASSPQIERWALKWADVLLDALRRSTKTDKPGVREALEALRPFAETFANADDPGVSDLYDEQPFSLHVPLGAWRRARSAWRKLAAPLGLDTFKPNLVADTDKFAQRADIDGRQPEQNLNVAAAQIIDPVGGVEQSVNNVLRHDDEPPAIDGEQEYVDGFPISSPGGRV